MERSDELAHPTVTTNPTQTRINTTLAIPLEIPYHDGPTSATSPTCASKDTSWGTSHRHKLLM